MVAAMPSENLRRSPSAKPHARLGYTSARHFVDILTILAIGLGFVACSGSTEDVLAKVRALQNEGRVQESIPLLSKLIDEGNRDGEAMYRYGRALSLTGYPGRGIWALDSALNDPEWFVKASHQIALDAYRAKNQELTLQTLERLRADRTDSHEDDLAALLLELRVRVEMRRQYDVALELAETILDDYPDEQEAVRLKAVALIGLKQTDEAYDLIREAGILASEVSGGGADLAAAGDTPESAQAELAVDLKASDSKVLEVYWCTVRATFKREAGETDEASEIIDDCLGRYPSEFGLVNESIKLYTKLNRYDRVLEILRAAYADRPEDRDLRLALVQYLSSISDEKGAESILRETLDDAIEAAKENPGDAELVVAMRWVDYGGYLFEKRRKKEALDAYDEALAILGERASPQFLFKHADALILAGRYDDALAIAGRTPIEVHAPMIRGRVAFERHDFDQAIKELDGAALLWPDNAPIRYYLARSHEGVGDFDRAVEEYRQAMRADPTLSAVRERLARLHLAEGRVRHASTILSFVSPRKASEASTEMRLLEIEVNARLGLETRLAVPPTPELPPEVVRRRAMHALSRGLRMQSDPLAAERFLATLEKEIKSSSERNLFLRERVNLLLAGGEVDQALELAAKRASRQPKDLDVALALGQALVAGGSKLTQAEGILRLVVENRPDEVDAWISLGKLAEQKGDRAAAIKAYDRALQITPESWDALSPRLDQMVADGTPDQALARHQSFVEMDNPFDGVAALDLAKRLGDGDANREKRVALAKRAIRFGAGSEALDLLTELDPEAAAEYSQSSHARSRKDSGKAQPAAARSPKQAAENPTESAPEASPTSTKATS